MELTSEMRSPQVGEIDDDRRKRSRRHTKQLPGSERRDINSEPPPIARVGHHGWSRMQTADEAEERARRLSRSRHRDDFGRLVQAEPKGESTRWQTAMPSGRQSGERVRLVSANHATRAST